MSKIGKQPIKIPEGIEVKIQDNLIRVKSARGETSMPILRGVNAFLDSDMIKFELSEDDTQARSNWGTLRSLVNNAIEGLARGFQKTLILEGIGYRINKEGDDLILSLGFSHPVRYKARSGIIFELKDNTTLKVIGSDKALVGQVAAEIKSFKKPEPYKGKGFRYEGEVIRRKAGKKAAGSSSA